MAVVTTGVRPSHRKLTVDYVLRGGNHLQKGDIWYAGKKTTIDIHQPAWSMHVQPIQGGNLRLGRQALQGWGCPEGLSGLTPQILLPCLDSDEQSSLPGSLMLERGYPSASPTFMSQTMWPSPNIGPTYGLAGLKTVTRIWLFSEVGTF